MVAGTERKRIEEYIFRGVVSQIERVFGVKLYFGLLSDYSDAKSKVDANTHPRNTGRSFIRPSGFAFNQEGYRPNAIGGRGFRGHPTAATAGQPTTTAIVHPIPTLESYMLAFEIVNYDEIRRIWSLLAHTKINAALDFQIQDWHGVSFAIKVELASELAPPELGNSSGAERADVALMETEIVVHGFTSSLADAHEVPIIRFVDFDNELLKPI